MLDTRLRFAHVTMDCRDAGVLVAFWRPLIGVDRDPVREGSIVYLPWEGPGSLCFQEVPEERVSKNRVHMDFVAADLAAMTERVVQLGGRMLRDVTDDDGSWRVFGDPEGNEFCVAEMP